MTALRHRTEAQIRQAERHIDRCPSCGDWQWWPDAIDILTAHLDTAECHHAHHHALETAA